MVQSWYGEWNMWVYTESAWESHIVLLYEWLQNYFKTKEWLQNYFKTKEPIGREWCKILQKARTANPSATTMLAVAQWQMSCLWKDFNTRKQHVENISQMCTKKQLRRSSLPCHLSERLHSRGWQTPGNHQRHKPLKSKLPTRPYKHYFQNIVQNRLEMIDWWLMIAYIALFSALLSRLTALACGSAWMTSFYSAFFFFFFFFWISTEVVYLQRWHGWCHMKLQPSRRKSCVHHTTRHHVTSCKATYGRCMRV